MKNQIIESSVLASWVLAVYRAIQSYGVDPDPLLVRAGIDKSLLNQHQARIPSVKTNRLWQYAVEETRDPLIGARVPDYMTISTLYAVDAAAQASATFREMLQCSCRFSRIVTTAVELHLEERDGNGHLVFKKCGDVPLCNEAVDGFMFVIFVTLNPILQMLNSSHCFYHDVRVTRPQLPNYRLYEDTFCCPVHYSCEDNAVVVNADLLDIPLPGANPTFTQFSEEMLVSYLCRIQDQDIEMKVRGAIMESISARCLSKEYVASQMNTSVRNLTRKLSEIDLTFNQLVDSIRQEKAISLIKQVDLCLAEIAFQLGFVDANSFIRAFRRWTGMTPGHYRKSLLKD